MWTFWYFHARPNGTRLFLFLIKIKEQNLHKLRSILVKALKPKTTDIPFGRWFLLLVVGKRQCGIEEEEGGEEHSFFPPSFFSFHQIPIIW